MALDGLEPIVALTGAGISAESGVPTFRGEGGLWEDYRAQDLATPQAFKDDPELVWRFYAWRRQLVRGCRPNKAHTTLSEIERASDDFTLITQNIDGLHQRAGSQNVIELHGSLWKLRCTRCGENWRDLAVPFEEPIPGCPNCGSNARPDVVWFGESLDESILEKAFAASKRASTFLVIGTSAIVQPAASLPLVAKRQGASLIEFNLERTPISDAADERRQGPASAKLAEWWHEIR
ncbi:MAG: NAD-dependent deacylase [Anaerolineales bacterium]